MFRPYGWEVMNRTPYCPDIANGGLRLFEPIKRQKAGKYFATDPDVKEAVTSWLQTLNTSFFYARMYPLVLGWNKCINVNGD
jgi:hypothetical protein